MKYPPSSHDIDSGSKQQPRSKSPRATEATSVLKPSSVPELSIFPAFTPDPIRLAELKGSSTYSPPVSPTRGDAREIFAAIDKDQTFFNMLEARGLTLEPTAESSDVDKVSDRIDAVRCVDGRRRTLLHQACRCGNVQAAKCLLFHEANASARCRGGRTPFHEAVSSATGKTALELLKLLFEHDPAGISIVDANGSHVLHLAAIHGNLDVIKWCAGLITQSSGKRSVKSPSPISRYLMDLDITSFSGRNMLHYATYNGRLDVIKWLLGEDNLRRGELSWVALDVNGYSVLHYAAMGAPLEVCEWLVLKAPGRHELNLTARTSEGKTAMELASARPSSIRHFLADISKVPCVPSELRCVGADTTSLGVGWDIEPASSDTRLWETLKPMYFHLEICKKPASLSRASGFLTMLMLMPSTSPGSPRAPRAVSSALMSASSLLYWKPLGVLLQPEAREHWLCNLERDTEYLVRMRARNRNGFSGYTVPNLSGVFTTSDGGRRRSLSSLQRFFGAIKKDPPVEAIVLSFIGDLHFELLEARVSDSCNDNTVASEFGSCVFDGPQKHAVRELVWQGIPMSRRPEVYSQMSGALITKTRYPVDYFLSLIKRLKDPTDEVHSRAKSSRFSVSKKQIQVDLKRTFAGNDECWLASSMGQKSLERVLLAYALHNDALGYCQSMTFIVGRLLCLYHSQMLMESSDPIEVQERVFWLLHVLCEDFFPSYYTQGMTGLQVDGGVLEKLIRTRLPKLHRHFQRLHVPPMGLVLVTQWLLPLCCAVFPSETTFRFLDVLFFEGSSVVFAMAIALLRISQHKLLAENVDCTQLFRFLRARDQRLHDAPLLMEVANEEHQLLSAQVGPLRESVAQELGIDKGDNAFKSVKLSSLPVDELRPGDVDIHI
ncbi:hypothetical protein PC122_g10448 [Phytophthora cactorum]|nr:hypothetical protein PC122_g10448 [Phytophthora cactorum]